MFDEYQDRIGVFRSPPGFLTAAEYLTEFGPSKPVITTSRAKSFENAVTVRALLFSLIVGDTFHWN